MKTLKFADNLVDKILNGSKTVTWRFFDDKDLTLGDILEFVNSDNGKKFAQAEIIFIKQKKFSDIEENDFDGHETYKNKDEMLEVYKSYYGDRVSWDTIVKIIKFKITTI